MSELILYTTEDGRSQIKLRAKDQTVWLSQREMAELFDVSTDNVGLHLRNIFEDNELSKEATAEESPVVQTEGTHQVQRTVTLYNLDAILAVGYRVRSPRGVQFRRWASTVLKEFLLKGFALDDERLKNPEGRPDYFDEMLARIRDIRASEKRFYQKVAAALKAALPDATHLALGFDTRSGVSPGTAKTLVEGLAQGCQVRRDGKLVTVPLAHEVRRIDFGDGEKEAMTIPWGDVATAYYTTGIPNIQVFMPAPPKLIASARRANLIRPLLGLAWVQRLIKARIAKTVKGPNEEQRARMPTFVWGEATNARGDRKTARIRTANGYSLTIAGSLAVVEYLMSHRPEGGAYTPAKLAGVDLVTGLPGSGGWRLDEASGWIGLTWPYSARSSGIR